METKSRLSINAHLTQVYLSFSISSFNNSFIDNGLFLRHKTAAFSWIDNSTFPAEPGVWEISIFRDITDETKKCTNLGWYF